MVVDQLRRLAADHLLGRVPEHALGALVEDRDQPVDVEPDDRLLGRSAEDAGEALGLLPGPGLGHVERARRPEHDRQRHRHRRDQEEEDADVEAVQPCVRATTDGDDERGRRQHHDGQQATQQPPAG